MKSQTVPLGAAKAYEVKKKAKFKPENTAFCNSPTCLREVIITDDNRCIQCGQRVMLRQKTNESLIKRFQCIVDMNREAIDSAFFVMAESENIRIPVKIAQQYYFVAFRYFVEFENIQQSDSKDYDEFFEKVKNISPTSKLS